MSLMIFQKRNLIILFSFFAMINLSSCQGVLMTRSDLKEAEKKNQIQDQVVNLQKTTADTNSRFAEIEEDLRRANGRIEVLENRLMQAQQEKEKNSSLSEQSLSEQNRKTLILQEEVIKLQEQVEALKAEVQNSKNQTSNNSNATSSAGAKKNAYEIGEDLFDKKDWRRAILSYQKYRDTFPKGRQFADATYKIGVCFQELGMKEEAKTFYDEVVAKFGNSPEAKKARTRLRSLKK